MSLSNSFISSFESLEAKAPAARLRYVCHVVCTMLCTLAVIDIGTSLVFPLPTSPIKPANSLANYFQYGRSVRNKIRYIMGTEDGNANKNALIGWLPEKAIPLPPKDHALTLSVYGMSFSNHVGRALVEMEPTIGLRLFDGLGARSVRTKLCRLRTQGISFRTVILLKRQMRVLRDSCEIFSIESFRRQ